jgi:TRAP transporter 4TM/12TM fusion protein
MFMPKLKSRAYALCAYCLCLLVVIGVNTNLFHEQPNLALFGTFGLLLVFLEKPFLKRWENHPALLAVDLTLCAGTVLAFGYVFVQSEPMLEAFWINGQKLGDRAGLETRTDTAMACIGIVLVLEATRRAIGWTLPALCAVFILYAVIGPSLPDQFFPHRGFTLSRIANNTFLQSGVFGIALKVMFMYVFLFVLFGTLLEQTGATGYIINVSRRLFRNSTGGPAKVAVLSSGLMGSLSGSAVANTATTGTFTIPLMRSVGFKKEDAGGIEAAASSGGALMPPIMGAGAYMMLELLSPITYLEIIRAAILPALLFYTALLLCVHFQAKRIGARTEDAIDAQDATLHPFQGVVFFGAFATLILLLLIGRTPFRAVSISLVTIVVLSQFNAKTRVSFSGLKLAMVNAAKSGVALIAAASCVGIILGIVTMTGVGAKLPGAILPLASQSLLLALMLLMVSTLILGMGLPSAVCYLLMANLVGKVLNGMPTPTLAAHLFIFYFGMMSMVTPPVALAAYTAAAIAKGHIMRTACSAFRYALVGFALPYAFVLRPELLMLSPDGTTASLWKVIINLAPVLCATAGLAAAVVGYARMRIKWRGRLTLFVCSSTIFFIRPVDVALYMQATACIVILGMLLRQSTSPAQRTMLRTN